MKYDFKDEILKNSGLFVEDMILQNLLCLKQNITDHNEVQEVELLANIMSLQNSRPDFFALYKPLIESKDKRSFSDLDLTITEARFLFENIETLSDNPAILSRVFDVLWICKYPDAVSARSAGEKASAYYLQYGNFLLENGCFFAAGKIFHRYLLLAQSFGMKSEKIKEAVDLYKNLMNIEFSDDTEPFFRPLYKLHSEGNFNLYTENEKIIQKIILDSEQYINSHFDTSNDTLISYYINIIIAYSKKRRDVKKQNDTWFLFSNYYKNRAEKVDDALFKTIMLKKSIECLRKIIGNPYKEKILEIQTEIESLQAHIVPGMAVIKVASYDFTADINFVISQISGKSIAEALKIFSDHIRLIKREEIERCSAPSLTEQIATIITVNERGQTIKSNGYTNAELRTISFFYNSEFFATILPMLQTIQQEHRLSDFSFVEMLTNNSWVPDGYAKSYSKGLYYYLMGEYFEAAHILIPAFENSLRYVLSIKRPITYTNTQDVDLHTISINDLVDGLENEKVIDQTIALNLKYFFGSDIGCNLRNQLMHGLFHFDETHSHIVIYALSLIFKIVMHHYILSYTCEK